MEIIMDLGTFIGILTGIICVVISILLDGSMKDFYNLPSIFIVIGGGIASTLIAHGLKEVISVFKVLKNAFFGKTQPPYKTIRLLVELSHKARREGLLSLEAEMENIEDPFIKNSLQMVIDGIEDVLIKETLELELDNLSVRHQKGQAVLRTMSNIFPAWGMIGTLIGLVQLLKKMNDPSTIGPAMAVALLTTFYGSVLSNLFCGPFANKLSEKSKEEIRLKEMVIEGILSIQAGENPRIMEHKLKTFLSPAEKLEYDNNVQNTEQKTEFSEAAANR